MKFKLNMTKYFFDKDELPQYVEIGFVFKEDLVVGQGVYIVDDDVESSVEFSDFNELKQFLKEWGKCVVETNDDNMSIEIYNDYRE